MIIANSKVKFVAAKQKLHTCKLGWAGVYDNYKQLLSEKLQ